MSDLFAPLQGYAAVFDREDSARDVIRRGAFTNSLSRRGTRGIKLLHQHDATQPIGLWDSIIEDAHGLFVRGRLLLRISRANETSILMAAGALDGLSIGFRPITAERDATRRRRILTEVDLWEISIVTFPMMDRARATLLPQQKSLLRCSRRASQLSPAATLDHHPN